jgi:hypothetical protein
VISGNITSFQISNANIITNQTKAQTIISFSVTGQNGTVCFGNLTIPKTCVIAETTPTIYIDNQSYTNQGYTQDGNNFYVWCTGYFNTNEIAIMFSQSASATSNLASIPEFELWSIISLVLVTVVAAIIFERKNNNC